MERSDLLPHILETLSAKKEFCDTFDNLCDELKIVLSADDLQNHEIEESIASALNVGQNLGILTLTNDLIRMPFKYNSGVKRPPTATKSSAKVTSMAKKVNQQGMGRTALYPERDQMIMTQPRRTHNHIPSIRDLGQIRKKRIVRRRLSNRISR